MTFTITLNDILIFLLSAAGLTLLIYLISAVIKLNKVLNDIKSTLDKNKSNIDSVMASLPEIAKNVNEITGDLNHGVQAIASTAENIGHSVTKASASMEEKAENVVDYIQVAGEMIKAIIGLFKKRK